jgi:hypothetical protein
MVFTDWETHQGVYGIFSILALSVDRMDDMNL